MTRAGRNAAGAHCAAGAAHAIADTMMGLGWLLAMPCAKVSATAFAVSIENVLVYASRSKRTCESVCASVGERLLGNKYV